MSRNFVIGTTQLEEKDSGLILPELRKELDDILTENSNLFGTDRGIAIVYDITRERSRTLALTGFDKEYKKEELTSEGYGKTEGLEPLYNLFRSLVERQAIFQMNEEEGLTVCFPTLDENIEEHHRIIRENRFLGKRWYDAGAWSMFENLLGNKDKLAEDSKPRQWIEDERKRFSDDGAFEEWLHSDEGFKKWKKLQNCTFQTHCLNKEKYKTREDWINSDDPDYHFSNVSLNRFSYSINFAIGNIIFQFDYPKASTDIIQPQPLELIMQKREEIRQQLPRILWPAIIYNILLAEEDFEHMEKIVPDTTLLMQTLFSAPGHERVIHILPTLSKHQGNHKIIATGSSADGIYVVESGEEDKNRVAKDVYEIFRRHGREAVMTFNPHGNFLISKTVIGCTLETLIGDVSRRHGEEVLYYPSGQLSIKGALVEKAMDDLAFFQTVVRKERQNEPQKSSYADKLMRTTTRLFDEQGLCLTAKAGAILERIGMELDANASFLYRDHTLRNIRINYTHLLKMIRIENVYVSEEREETVCSEGSRSIIIPNSEFPELSPKTVRMLGDRLFKTYSREEIAAAVLPSFIEHDLKNWRYATLADSVCEFYRHPLTTTLLGERKIVIGNMLLEKIAAYSGRDREDLEAIYRKTERQSFFFRFLRSSEWFLDANMPSVGEIDPSSQEHQSTYHHYWMHALISLASIKGVKKSNPERRICTPEEFFKDRKNMKEPYVRQYHSLLSAW